MCTSGSPNDLAVTDQLALMVLEKIKNAGSAYVCVREGLSEGGGEGMKGGEGGEGMGGGEGGREGRRERKGGGGGRKGGRGGSGGREEVTSTGIVSLCSSYQGEAAD